MANISKKTKMNDNNNQQVIDDIPNYNITLNTMHDCRRLVNWAANMIRRRKIKVDEGKALVYCAITTSQMIKDMELRPEIIALKQIVAEYEAMMKEKRY